MSTEKSNDKSLRMIEFFSGIGGMRLAVENALQQQSATNDETGVSLLLVQCQAYDISLHANISYMHNFENDDSSVCTKLVEQLKPKDLDGKADLWTMSPPCQPFTTTRGAKAKELDSEDKSCDWLKAIMRLLADIQQKPKCILLENAKGFSKSRMVEKWYECLEGNGYTWKEYLVSPIQIGIPNNRPRYYIICEHSSSRWKDIKGTIHLSLSDAPAITSMQPVANYVDASLTSKEQLADFIVPDSTLQQNWALQVGVVTGADTATDCFTAGYGRIFHKTTGSLLLMPSSSDKTVEQEAIATNPLDRSDLLQYRGRLRRFTPKELLALFGFPLDYAFPEELQLEHQYTLIGNSINVTIVTELVKELLFGDKEGTVVGGTKGHVEETIHGNLLLLYQSYRWKMIPNCTGRYTCRDHKLVSPLNPFAFLQHVGIEKLGNGSKTMRTNDGCLKEFQFDLPGRPDTIIVVPLDDHNMTGVITFVKEEGVSYVHTLNTPSGFRRKLEAIGIEVTEDDICLADNGDTKVD